MSDCELAGNSGSGGVPPDAVEVLSALGIRVAQRRAQLSIRQADLAQLAGLNRVTISRIERGHMDIGVVTLHRLAWALAVSPGDLLARALPPDLGHGV